MTESGDLRLGSISDGPFRSHPSLLAEPERSGEAGRKAIILLALYSSVLLILIVLQVMFTNRTIWGDEDGLYNAIYMYEHYGKVTYPMQQQPFYVTIHPPAHYFVVGVLVRLGLS